MAAMIYLYLAFGCYFALCFEGWYAEQAKPGYLRYVEFVLFVIIAWPWLFWVIRRGQDGRSKSSVEMTMDAEALQPNAVQIESTGRFNPDWQVTSILSDGLYIETDCNSGRTRRVRTTQCQCGKPVEIEYGTNSCRRDRKRVYHPEDRDAGWCLFRCKVCGQPVSDSVPGAEHEA